MNKYFGGKIYGIISEKLKKIYIGSTINKINKRFNDHKYRYRKGINKCTSSIILEDKYAYIKVLEDFPCHNDRELRNREGFHTQTFKDYDVVNKRIEGRTKKQYYLQNINSIKEKKRIYRDNNREFINEKIKCEICDSYFTRTNRSHHIKTKKHRKNMIK